jgi:hypothetical protein
MDTGKGKSIESGGEVVGETDLQYIKKIRDTIGEPILKELKMWVFFYKEMEPGNIFQVWVAGTDEQLKRVTNYLAAELRATVETLNFNSNIFSNIENKAKVAAERDLIFVIRDFDKKKTSLTGHGYNQVIAETFLEKGKELLGEKKLMILHHLSNEEEGFQENLVEAATSTHKFGLMSLSKE